MSGIGFLVVDDADPFRRVLCQLIEQHAGWQVAGEAKDGTSVLDLVERLAPAVVLMDIHMPGANGLEVTRRLKMVYPETRIVLFTGHRIRTLAEAGRAAGADAFLWKEDLDVDILESLLLRWSLPPAPRGEPGNLAP